MQAYKPLLDSGVPSSGKLLIPGAKRERNKDTDQLKTRNSGRSHTHRVLSTPRILTECQALFQALWHGFAASGLWTSGAGLFFGGNVPDLLPLEARSAPKS